MNSPRRVPEGGIPTVFSTRNGVIEAARILAQGSGPIAIDTERASSFRYDDRAFLIQLRRPDTPIVLIAPEGIRSDVREFLAPVINGEEWIVHAAATDLTCLAWLGLYPGKLFDTEVAGRLLGIPNPNLAYVTEEFLGIELDKGYGATDWSRFPLSKAQLAYAALDVETLIDLAEEMAYDLEQDDKAEWARQEFAAIASHFGSITEPAPRSWIDSRGIRGIYELEGLAVAKAVWEEREQQAYDADIAPGQIISNSSLVDIARHIPRSINQLRRISQLRNRSAAELKKWVTIISTAADSDPKSWPEIPVENHEYPTKQFLKNNHPDLNELVNVLREDRDDLGEDIAVVPDSLVSVAVLRSAVWATRGDIRSPQYGEKAQTVTTTVQLEEFLREHGLRNWQVEQLTPVLESALL